MPTETVYDTEMQRATDEAHRPAQLEQLLDRMRELVPHVSPMGAYTLGALTKHAIQTQIWPTEEEISAAARCLTIQESAALIDRLRLRW